MIGIDWERIDVMPSSRHHALRAAAALLGLMLGFIGFIHPPLQRLELATTQIQHWKARISTLQLEARRGDDEELRLTRARQDLSAMHDHFTDEGTLILDLADLSQLAELLRLHVLHLEPLPSTTVDWRIEYPLDLSLSGAFPDLARFLAVMGKLPRLFVIERMELRPLQRDTVIMHARLRFAQTTQPLPDGNPEHFMPAAPSPPEQVPGTVLRMVESGRFGNLLRNPFRDPGLPDMEPADAPGALEELQLAAILRSEDTAWALVRMPDRQLRKLRVGEQLDRDGHRIEAIHLRGLSLRAPQDVEASGTRPSGRCWPRPDDC